MQWIEHYQVFLFDFDGLLVDTEKTHYASYVEMCRRNGADLTWDFERFCQEAHQKAGGVWEGIIKEFPHLTDRVKLYEEKKKIYVDMLRQGTLEFMPGVERLLQRLSEHNIKRAVVTNSPREHIDIIKESLPLLKTIPLWVTRECYEHPKPAPDGYLKAIEELAAGRDQVIGFEDTFKGLQALLAAHVKSVLICPAHMSHVRASKDLGALHFDSFLDIHHI